jgi:o-succinylbenzoate---CoA ligase
VSQLLDPGIAVLMGIEARLDQAQGEGREGEHLAAASDCLGFEAVERHNVVDQAHLESLLGVVLAAQQPELLGLLGADQVSQEGDAEATVPRADPRAGLPEAGVVGGNREVAADMEDVATADGITGHHRHHRLWQPPHLHLQVRDVEAAQGSALGDVPGVAANLLVAAGAKRLLSLASQDHHTDLGVLASQLERGGDLDQCLGSEGVEDLRPVDADLGDPVAHLVVDVGVLGGAPPLDRCVQGLFGRGFLVAFGHDGHDIPPMKLDDWLAQRSQSCPERPALVADGSAVTYAELEAEATWVARRLIAHGVRRGSTVAMTMHPRREQVVMVHALMKAGAVLLPLSPRLSAVERAAVIAAEEPAVDLDDAGELTQTEADLPLLGEHDMDDIASRVMTSGSSGTPNPVGLTYGNFLWSAVASAFNIGVEPEDRWLCCLPLSHVSGLSIVMRSVIYGTTALLHDGFDVDRVVESLDRGEVTVVSLVTTMLTRLLEAGADLSGPRAILVGGGPVPEDPLEEALGRGATVVQTYGLTETCSQVTTLAPADARRKLGSAGRPLLTTHLRIQEGEILVQGPTVAPGRADADGWLHTGDLGRIDEEGFLYVDDRIDDMIVSGGENVIPAEVEKVLLRHPEVADAAVVGRDDPEWQQAVTAIVVLQEGSEVSPDELRRHCAESLAGFKVPKRVELAAALPRTPSGKLMRRALR